MSKFMTVYQPVEEGWPTALVRVAQAGSTAAVWAGQAMVAAGAIKGSEKMILRGAKAYAGGAVTAGPLFWLTKIIGTLSNLKLKKLLNDPKLQKYLQQECQKLLKEEQKKDSSVTAKIPKDIPTLVSRWWHNNDEVGFFSKPNFLMQHDDWIDDEVFDLKVGNFVTTFWYDTQKIDAAVVIFYSAKYDKCIGRRIPAPSDKQLKEMFG